MPRPASTRCWIRSGRRGPTAVPIAVPASTVPTLMSVPTIAAVQDGRRRRVAAAALRDARPRAIVYSSSTAALLWPEPGAIRFDAPAAGNRPGRQGIWQRPLERRRFAAAPLLL